MDDIQKMQAYFEPPAYAATEDSAEIDTQAAQNPAFGRWFKHNVIAHKQAGYRIVTVSLKDPNEAPGDCTAEQMERAADLADQYGFGAVRTTHEQNVTLPVEPHPSLYNPLLLHH